MLALENLPSQWRNLHLVMRIIRHLKETHLQHLQQISLPVAHAHVLAHAKRLQLIIMIPDNGRCLHAPENLDTRAHGNLLAGSHHGTERLLREYRTVESARRIVANIAVTAVLCRCLSEVIQENAAAAHT